MKELAIKWSKLLHKQPRLMAFIGLALSAILVYGNVLNGDFLINDEGFLNLVSSPGSHSFQPLVIVLKTIIIKLFGHNRLAFHSSSLLLHLANSLIVYFLLRRFKFVDWLCFLGALFFMLHPAQTSAVSYISNVSVLLGTFFMLLGSLTYIRFSGQPNKLLRWRDAWLVILCYIAALGSSEIALVFPVLLVFIDLSLYRNKRFRASFWKTPYCFIWLAIMIVFAWYRYRIIPLDTHGLWTPNTLYSSNPDIRGLTFLGVLWQYFQLIVFPLDLYLARPLLLFADFREWPVIFGLLTLLGGVSVTIWFAMQRKILPIFIFFWFFVCLFPYAGIVRANATYQEHWLYGSLIAVAVLVVALLSEVLSRTKNPKLKHLVIALLVILLISYGLRDILRNREWADKILFCQNELEFNPNSIVFNNELAMAYSAKGNLDQAVFYYKKAIAIADNYPQTHHNLARVYVRQSLMREALDEYYLSLRINPNYLYSHIDLQSLYTYWQDQKRAAVHARFITRILSGESLQFYEIKRQVLGF